MQAVICTLKLEDFVTSSRRARQSDGMHGGFRTAVTETHHLHWKAITNFLGQFPFQVMRHAKHGAGTETFFHSFHDGRMAVAGHERAEAEVVIDVFVAVQIAELTAPSLLHEDGIGIVGAIVTGYAQRNTFEILLVGFGGLGSAPLEGCEFFLQVGVHRGLRKCSGQCGH